MAGGESLRTAHADPVLFEVRGPLAIVTINRPEARNAINGDVAGAIERAIDRLEGDDELLVGVLAATGPVFSAGADLKEVRAGGAGAPGRITARGGFGGFARRLRDKPVVVAVEGPALAGGLEIVLAADLVVASRRASFGLPEVKRSLIAAAGGLQRLPRRIPLNVAMECALTGDPITAERAHHFGLVNLLVDEGEALAASLALAGRIADNAPLAVRESRRVLLESSLASDEEGSAIAEASLARLVESDGLPVALARLDAPLGHDGRVAQLVQQRLEGALDVVLVESGAHRGAIDARIVRATHVLVARAARRGGDARDDEDKGKRDGDGRRGAGANAARALVHGAIPFLSGLDVPEA